MFGYVSFARLTEEIRRLVHLVPRDVDLIVGIPRSGMLPAYLIGLFTNRQVVDLESFLANRMVAHGETRPLSKSVAAPLEARHILLVDDSVASGTSMKKAIDKVKASTFTGQLTTCGAIVEPSKIGFVDIHFMEVPHPRVFEWNALHHSEVKNSCFDMDGVLCVDPTERENDDGHRYVDFLCNARPLFVPATHIGHIVSARLEKYREPTEDWLRRHHISYGALHLLNLPTKADRLRAGSHSQHKAEVYRRTGAFLFYESNAQQARDIAVKARRPVLCVENMNLYLPTTPTPESVLRNTRWRLQVPISRVKSMVKSRIFNTP